MIVSVNNPKKSIKKPHKAPKTPNKTISHFLELISELGNVVGYKIKIQKSSHFYMLIMDVGTYTIAPIKMKNLGINTIKYI